MILQLPELKVSALWHQSFTVFIFLLFFRPPQKKNHLKSENIHSTLDTGFLYPKFATQG